MAISWSSFKHGFYSRSRQHALTPLLNAWPIVYVHAQKFEHPWHGEWKIGKVSDSGAVWQSNVILPRPCKAIIQDGPLLEAIGMQPEFFEGCCQLSASLFEGQGAGSLLGNGFWERLRALTVGISFEEIKPILCSRPKEMSTGSFRRGGIYTPKTSRLVGSPS